MGKIKIILHLIPTKKLPCLKWKDGACSLSKISSVHAVGLLLTIVVVSLTDRGNKFFNDRFADAPGGTKRTRDMRCIFSMLLAHWSWLKKEKMLETRWQGSRGNCFWVYLFNDKITEQTVAKGEWQWVEHTKNTWTAACSRWCCQKWNSQRVTWRPIGTQSSRH